jgi:hypothetical protein
MRDDGGRWDLGCRGGYRLFAIQDAVRVRGYAVRRNESDSESFAVTGASVEAVERCLRQLVDAEAVYDEAELERETAGPSKP